MDINEKDIEKFCDNMKEEVLAGEYVDSVTGKGCTMEYIIKEEINKYFYYHPEQAKGEDAYSEAYSYISDTLERL